MDPQVKPLAAGTTLCGPAVTVRIAPPDGSAIYYAIDVATPGDVLVVDTGGDLQHACWGDGTSTAARVRGIQGVIIDGAATDVQAVRAMQFPVFCRTVSALTTKALHLTGEVNAPIRCGGVSVAPGDLILADENGVVVVSPGECEHLVTLAEAFERDEQALHQQIASGESLVGLSRMMGRGRKGDEGG